MKDRIVENNQVSIIGKIVSGFIFSHKAFEESFYIMNLSVPRLSGTIDIIPVMISERLIDVTQDYEGEYIQIFGQFRSCNHYQENKYRLVLSVFAREVSFVKKEYDKVESNQIFLDGYICKRPVYRRTPSGREIADVILAVNRPDGKSDYIPCICWGRNARFVSELEVGGNVKAWGRIQSREYVKRIEDNSLQKKVAYEVSISSLSYYIGTSGLCN